MMVRCKARLELVEMVYGKRRVKEGFRYAGELV